MAMLGGNWEDDHSDEELPAFEFDGGDVVGGLGGLSGLGGTSATNLHEDYDDDEEESALFVREQLQFEPTRAQGKLVSIAAGGDCLLMATDKRLVIALAMSGDQKLFIIPKKSNDDVTHKIFCDPMGLHCIVTLQSKKNFYISLAKDFKRPIPLQKLRGLRLESVVWQRQTSRVMTGRLLLGTHDGCIYEYEIYDNKEKMFAKLFDLKTEQYGSTLNSEEQKDNKSWRICGLHVEKLAMPKDIHGRQSSLKRASQVYEAQNEKLKGLGFLDDDSDSEDKGADMSQIRSKTTMSMMSNSGVVGDGNDTVNVIHGTGSSSKSKQMFYVIAAIPSALYEFVGGPTYDEMFKQYNSRTTHKQMLTDGALKHTKLEVYTPHGDMPEAVGWLTEVGITMCNISLGSQIAPHSFVVGEKLTDMKEDHIIRYGPLDASDDWHGKDGQIPISFVITQFHVVIIYPDCYLAVNKLNKKCVHFESFPTNKAGVAKEVCVMDSTIFIICDSQIFQIRPQNEKRDVWELYLHKNDFHSALQYATTYWQKQRVLRREAEYCFQQGSYEEAARKYTELSDINRRRQARRNPRAMGLLDVEAKERSHDVGAVQEEDAALDVTFEEIALKFLNVGATDALMTFLGEKLNRIGKNDKTQRSILATWLCEMHLAKINESAGDPDEEAAAIDDFEEFYTNQAEILRECKDVVRNLIASHGRPEILIDFARNQQDWAFVTQYYVGQGQYQNAITQLGSLQQPRHFEDLYYIFAPVLMFHHPVETVDMLLKIKALDPKKLIPALMRYDTVETMISSITGNVGLGPDGALGAAGLGSRNGGLSAMMQEDTVITSQAGMDFDFDADTLTARKSTVHDARERKEEQDPLRYDVRDQGGRDARDGRNGRDRTQHTVSEEHANQAIRYLEFSISNRHEKSQDTTIHNYLVSLYCKQRDESALLNFIETQKKKPIFDVKYALRLCHQENKTRSCVELYKIMKLYQEAVMLALQIKEKHFALAKSIAHDFKELEPTKKAEQKNLWLIIAKHVVGTAGPDNIDSVLSIIGESNNILSIEDILPCLNDFTQIGPFKKNIKESLEKYSKDINKLQKEMEQYTKNADDIRKDTKSLTNRSAMVTSNRKCDLSGQNVLGSQFLVFPCRHVFRIDALLDRIQEYRMQNSLALLRKNAPESELMEAASERCPLCSEIMIDEVTRPFIDETDLAEVGSWEIDSEITQVSSLNAMSTKIGR